MGYLNADGFGDFESSPASLQGALHADGAAPVMASNPVSKPYIVIVANTTTANISNVEVLKAATRQFNIADQSGVSFTYGIPNFTYTQFLSTTQTQPFTVGMTRLISTNVSQIQSVCTVATYDPSGAFVGMPLIPTYDSYQYQTGQIDVPYEYIVNSNTSFVVATLYGSATLTIQFYPINKVAQINQLTGASGNTQTYGRPNVNPALR